MKAERLEIYVLCDRPGCGRRVTKNGGRMATIKHEFITITDPDDAEVYETPDYHVDLCRECLLQMTAMWARKAGDE